MWGGMDGCEGMRGKGVWAGRGGGKDLDWKAGGALWRMWWMGG